MVIGASLSIDVLNPSFFYQAGVDLHDFAVLADNRLRRRLLLTHPGTDYPFQLDGEWWLAKDFFRAQNWEVRRDCDYTHMGCVLVDEEQIILLDPGGSPYSTSRRTHVLEGEEVVAPYSRYFDALWGGYEHSSALLWDDLLFPGFPDTGRRIAVAADEDWSKVIRYLTRNPMALYELTPRKFERLIAELLQRDGYVTTLTPERKDGGFDVFALQESPAGRHLYLVECKRFAQQHPVGVSIVRALYGVVESTKASAGLVVTTSRFTKGALEFQTDVPYRMNLRQYEGLLEWLQRHSRSVH
jgi:hypothetical protein